MKAQLIIAVILFSTIQGMAQSPNPGVPPFTAQNNILVLKYYPSDKSGKIFLFGKKAADLDLKTEAKLVSVTLLNRGKSEELRVSSTEGGYLVEATDRFPSDYQLLMNAEVRGQQQQLKVRVKKAKP